MFEILDNAGNVIETATSTFEGYRVIDSLDRANPSNGPHVFAAFTTASITAPAPAKKFSFFGKVA